MIKFDIVKSQSPYTNRPHTLWYVMEKTGERRYLQNDGTLGRQTYWFPIRESARNAIKRFRENEVRPEVKTAKVWMVTNPEGLGCAVRYDVTGNKGFRLSGNEPTNGRLPSQTLVDVGVILGLMGVSKANFSWTF